MLMDVCKSALRPLQTSRSEIQYFHRPELDLLRLTAFLMVFVAHTPRFQHLGWVMEAGGNGVCLFFLLSAFLIAELLMQERDHTHSVHARAYLLRRILRIWPLYFLAIGLGVAVGKVLPYLHVSPRSIPWLLLFGSNFYIAHYGWELSALGPLWSLSVEEQFYLAIPWIIKFDHRHLLREFAICCFPLAYGMLLWFGHTHATPNPQVWVNSLVQSQFFAAGILLALHFHTRGWNIAVWQRLGLLTAGAVILVAGQIAGHLHGVAPTSASRLCLGYFMVLLSCIMLFLGFFNMSLRIPRALLYLGRISYGLYVYHTFFLLILAYRVNRPSARQLLLLDLISLGLTVLTASISYQCFERPFLRLKQRFTFVTSDKLVEVQ